MFIAAMPHIPYGQYNPDGAVAKWETRQQWPLLHPGKCDTKAES
jgi:hypothetical protein